jgi:hypothetical protein
MCRVLSTTEFGFPGSFTVVRVPGLMSCRSNSKTVVGTSPSSQGMESSLPSTVQVAWQVLHPNPNRASSLRSACGQSRARVCASPQCSQMYGSENAVTNMRQWRECLASRAPLTSDGLLCSRGVFRAGQNSQRDAFTSRRWGGQAWCPRQHQEQGRRGPQRRCRAPP